MFTIGFIIGAPIGAGFFGYWLGYRRGVAATISSINEQLYLAQVESNAKLMQQYAAQPGSVAQQPPAYFNNTYPVTEPSQQIPPA